MGIVTDGEAQRNLCCKASFVRDTMLAILKTPKRKRIPYDKKDHHAELVLTCAMR